MGYIQRSQVLQLRKMRLYGKFLYRRVVWTHNFVLTAGHGHFEVVIGYDWFRGHGISGGSVFLEA